MTASAGSDRVMATSSATLLYLQLMCIYG